MISRTSGRAYAVLPNPNLSSGEKKKTLSTKHTNLYFISVPLSATTQLDLLAVQRTEMLAI